MKPKSDLAAAGGLIALGWAFGAAFLFMKVLADEATPGAVVVGRLFFGSLVVWAFLFWRGAQMDWRPAWLAQVTLLATVEMVVPYTLIMWAEVEIESGVASVLISAMPLFTALIASVSLPEEALTRRQLLGLGIGFVGVLVVSGAGAGAFADGRLLAMLAVVLAAACYAAGIVYARVLLRRSEPVSLTGQQLLMGTIVAFAGVTIVGGMPSYRLSSEGWAALLALGAVSTGVGTLAGFFLVRLIGSVRTSLVTYIVPVAGLTLGWAVLGETIGLNVMAGLVLIATGVTLVLRGSVAAAASPSRAIPVSATRDTVPCPPEMEPCGPVAA